MLQMPIFGKKEIYPTQFICYLNCIYDLLYSSMEIRSRILFIFVFLEWTRRDKHFTCVGSTCCPQCRCENEMIGALFGRIGDSVWNTMWSQSTDTAPCCDLPPNDSTLHRHGKRRAVLNSGHGCQFDASPWIWWTSNIHNQNIRNVCVCHLFDIILGFERRESHTKKKWRKKKRMKLVFCCCSWSCLY